MNKYQICMAISDHSTAGSKAPNDVYEIAKNAGYSTLYVNEIKSKNAFISKIVSKLNFKTDFSRDWKAIYKKIEKDSIVLLQVPNVYSGDVSRRILTALKEKKRVKLVCLLHDVDELRMAPSEDLEKSKKQHDFALNIADAIIIHNESMLNYLVSQGADKEKLVVLGIFDYLTEGNTDKKIEFEKKVVIAGNLDSRKSAYIANLPKLDGVNLELFGPNFDECLSEAKNVVYRGTVKPEILPEKLTSGFGLIWDGDSIETCNGIMGNYLRYNNPHKLSLYLASGLPVVIWKQAAEAKFVVENNVGICVDSLSELKEIFESIHEVDYMEMLTNIAKIGEQIRSGYYITTALTLAEEKVMK